MATIDQVRTLSTPKVLIDGVLWPIVPNSYKFSIPGETKVRAMSAGGGGVQIVAGLDASALKGKVKFEVAATRQMIDRVRTVKDNSNRGVGSTIRADDGPWGQAWQTMFLVNDTEVEMEAEGKIALEFEGEYVP
jgi:hypothetical protein